ncbi:hypothetical protein H2198_007948 [Neophaeococcomyces mojaviensis]|uniref:Uncharacterized protein n=1 Tax=Neophaeococcomyces mojaviensis TaxID=3383035 RepID=A0ACC2ZYY2_9EURO|nr:hypothetical protein H2198_007948 [Knufia sp. JES_112]
MRTSLEDQAKLINEVLLTGPADSRRVLERIQAEADTSHSTAWLYLLEASRSSQYAVAWREAFGRKRLSHPEPNSILELAIENLAHAFSHPIRDSDRNIVVSIFPRILANCCVENDHNRRLTIQAGGIGVLMRTLAEGNDPNVLVPAIYNICTDIEDPAEHMRPHMSTTSEPLNITIAEERLATLDSPSNSVLSGLLTLLSPSIIQACDGEIKEYLADLMEMAVKPIIALGDAAVEEGDPILGRVLARMHSSDAGILLSGYSVRSRISVIKVTLTLLTLPAARVMLATTGSIFYLSLMVEEGEQSHDYYGEDEEEQKENATALNSLQTAMMKAVYEVCQMPEFTNPPKYGIARQSVDILYDQNPSKLRAIKYSVAFAMLYGFVDSDARANLLVAENAAFIPTVLFWMRSNVKEIVYPALALATKLAITWNLKRKFYEVGAVMVVDHLLTTSDFGYDIPLNAITFLELLVTGQPEHIGAMLLTYVETGRSVLNDIHVLFDRGHDPICFEIGRLMIEIISTLAHNSHGEQKTNDFTLDVFLAACDDESLAKVLIWTGTKGLELDPVNAQRVWFALGLLSTSERGKQIAHLAVQDPDFSARIQQEMSLPDDTPAKRNISYMIYSINGTLDYSSRVTAVEDLNDAVARMSIGGNVGGSA